MASLAGANYFPFSGHLEKVTLGSGYPVSLEGPGKKDRVL